MGFNSGFKGLKAKKDTHHQVLFKSQQKWLKQWVEQFAMRSVNLLILFGIRINCLRSVMSRPLYLSIGRVIKQIVIITGAYHFREICTKLYPTSCCQDLIHMQRKLLGIINVNFDATVQLLIIYVYIIIIITIIIYLPWSWVTSWPVPVSRIQKYYILKWNSTAISIYCWI